MESKAAGRIMVAAAHPVTALDFLPRQVQGSLLLAMGLEDGAMKLLRLDSAAFTVLEATDVDARYGITRLRRGCSPLTKS